MSRAGPPGASRAGVAAQSTGTITAPSANPRIDRVVVDRATGVASVITGAENASPVAPAITAGKVPVAQVAFVVSQSSIVNADITDERQLGVLGLKTAAFEAVGTGANQVVQLDGSSRLPAVDGSQLTGIVLGATAAEAANIKINALRIAVLEDNAFNNQEDGIVDAYTDQSGVDTAASTNETYDAAGDFYTNKPGAYGSDQITGSETYSADNEAGGDADLAADGNTGVDGWKTLNDTTHWWKVDFGAANDKKITKYIIYTNNDDDNTIQTDLKLQGSATGSFSGEETTLDTFDTTGWTIAPQTHPRTFTNTTAYRYYRLLGTQGSGRMGAREIEMFEDAAVVNMTLQSVAFAAEAVPSTIEVLALWKDIDAATINTDFTFEVSRDGGTTYTTATLTDEGEFSTGVDILRASVTVTGQPSGTSIKYRAKTLNLKEQQLPGIALGWS